MIYNFSFLLPSNTPLSAMKKEEVKLRAGIIQKVEILFPAGCAGLAKVAIDRFNTQILPVNLGSFYYSDNETIINELDLPLKDRPYTLLFKGYNLDDTYPHNIQIRVNLKLLEELPHIILPSEESQRLIEEFGL